MAPVDDSIAQVATDNAKVAEAASAVRAVAVGLLPPDGDTVGLIPSLDALDASVSTVSTSTSNAATAAQAAGADVADLTAKYTAAVDAERAAETAQGAAEAALADANAKITELLTSHETAAQQAQDAVSAAAAADAARVDAETAAAQTQAQITDAQQAQAAAEAERDAAHAQVATTQAALDTAQGRAASAETALQNLQDSQPDTAPQIPGNSPSTHLGNDVPDVPEVFQQKLSADESYPTYVARVDAWNAAHGPEINEETGEPLVIDVTFEIMEALPEEIWSTLNVG